MNTLPNTKKDRNLEPVDGTWSPWNAFAFFLATLGRLGWIEVYIINFTCEESTFVTYIGYTSIFEWPLNQSFAFDIFRYIWICDYVV